MITFAWGTTRFVVLIGPLAFKFARFRGLTIAKRFWHHLEKGRVIRTAVKQVTRPRRLIRGFFVGLIANRIEARLWKESPQTWMVPTIWSAGFMNIQWRGEKVSAMALLEEHPLRPYMIVMNEPFLNDMIKHHNFCRYNGRVCLVDYGSQEFFDFFYQPEAGRVPVVA